MRYVLQIKVLAIYAVLMAQSSFSQEIFIDSQVSSAFFSLSQDLRKHNICIEDYGREGILIARDDSLVHYAIADGYFTEKEMILIRFNGNLMAQTSFEEMKFILLHEILHHKPVYGMHWHQVLGMRTYSADIPDYYKIALGQAAILLAK